MFVRNFFTKATAKHTGCFAFFNGSVLDVEAYFRVCFAGSDFFYLKIEEGLFSKPFIRVRYSHSHGRFSIREVEAYNPESGLYELTPISEKDRAFLRHITSTCSVVINKADRAWREKIDKMEDIPF